MYVFLLCLQKSSKAKAIPQTVTWQLLKHSLQTYNPKMNLTCIYKYFFTQQQKYFLNDSLYRNHSEHSNRFILTEVCYYLK